MSRKPVSILAKLAAVLAASALAVCAVLIVAPTPAHAASSSTYGNLTFSSDDPLNGVMYDAKGEVVISGSADITVTPAATPDGVNVTSIIIGGNDGSEQDYSGTLSFNGVTLNPVAIDMQDAIVNFTGCTLTGGQGAPTITANGECVINFYGATTLNGGAGASGTSPTEGTAALRDTGTAAIQVSGTMTVNGGAGGNLDAKDGMPSAGGAGIYAPNATLSMDSGTLTVKAGETYTASPEATPRVLPVGLTVGKFDLANGTGEPGGGPSITAVGWPTANSKPLPIDGLDAGSLDDDTFYPWVLQASQSPDGSNAFLMNFAGSGETEPVQREGWRWFNIAPHEVTGLDVMAISNMDEPDTHLANLTNPMPGGEDELSYTLGIVPTFDDLDDMSVYGWIEGAVVSNPTATPANAVKWLGEGDSFVVAPDYTGDNIAFSGTATLPAAFTALYPSISTSVTSTFIVEDVTAIYRLYNPYNGDHLYTADVTEVQSADDAGWNFEHAVWMQPAVPTADDATIIRLYNPYTSGHYYVPETDEAQINELLGYGWEKDSAAANLISVPRTEGLPIYTVFNPYAQTGTHLYTPNYAEVEFLETLGWQQNTTVIYSLPFVLVSDEA